MIRRAMANRHIHWLMNPAQELAINNLYVNVVIINQVEGKTNGETDFTTLSPNTLCGLPIEVRLDFPPDRIELRSGDEVLCRIENLAIPTVYFEGEQQ